MDFTRPEPPALPPGVIATHQPWHQRAWGLARRYRWEALPYYAAGSWWLAVETYAIVEHPGAGEITAFSTVAALSAAGTVACAIKGWGKAVVVSLGLTTSMGWAAWQVADPAPVGGLIMLGPLATAAGIPYWRLLAKARGRQLEREHEIKLAEMDVVKAAYGAQAIPGQRQAPAIETVAEPAGRVPGQMPVVPWPGAPGGLSIKDPIALSPHTSITLPGVHILVGGGTDMGKSGILHILCCNILERRDAKLFIIDFKPHAVEHSVYRLAGVRVASTPDEAMQMMADIRDEADRRGNRLGAKLQPDGTITYATSWTPTPEDPQLVLVIDELAELTEKAPKSNDELRSHTRLLRALAVTVIEGSQITSRRTSGGDTDGRGQFGLRIGVRVFEPGQTNMIFGQGAHGAGIRPDLLQEPGEFLALGRGHDGKTPDRAYLMTPQAIANHVARHATGPIATPEHEPEAFTAPAEPAFASTGSVTGDILAYLADRWATPKEVWQAIGGNQEAVRTRMAYLARESQGKLTKDSHGRYKATKQGAAIAGNIVQFPRRAKP